MGKARDGAHLYLVFWRAGRALERFDRESVENQGFACFSDFVVLETLWNKGPQTAGEIGKRVLLTSGSVTASIDRLVKKGYVRREKAPDDGRIVRVLLEAAGEDVISRAYEKHASNLESLFSILNEEERDQFYELVRRVGLEAAARTGD